MPLPAARSTVALAAAFAIACGGQTTPRSGSADGDLDANRGGSTTTPPHGGAAGSPTGTAGTSGAPSGTAGAASSGPIAGPTWTAPPSPPADVCLTRAEAASTRMAGGPSCSTVFRLDFQTLAPLGYGSLCDAYGAVDEASARQKAEGYMVELDGPTVTVTEPGAPDLFVFRRSSSYERRAIAISARHGGLVFGAITGHYPPSSDMLFPFVFFEGDELGLGCVPKTPRPSARGFDLVVGGPLAADRVQAAIDAVWHTAVPDGLADGGAVFDAVVLLTQPDYDAFRPERARYTVIVSSGLPE